MAAPPEAAAWMERALAVAERGAAQGEVPVGALVLSPEGEMLAEAHDERESTGDPTAHAEIIALRRVGERRGRWNLEDCTLVVTLEPCPMCAGALVMARIARVIWGAPSAKTGACGSRIDLLEPGLFNHDVEMHGGVRAEACAAPLQRFFAARRPPPESS
jgi:tRNA(adenine34) deaminase